MRCRQCRVSRFWSGRHPSTRLSCFFLVVVPVLATILSVTSSHPDIASDANATSLLCDHSAERGTFSETRKLLRTVYNEGHRLDLHAVRYVRVACRICRRRVAGFVVVLFTLQLLIQAETQPVHALVPYREVGKDEVASRRRPVKVHHARNGSASQDGQPSLVLGITSLGDRTCLLQCCEEEVVCVHVVSNVVVSAFALIDLELDDWRWIHRPSVGGRYVELARDAVRHV